MWTGALVVDVGECGLRICPIEGSSLSPVAFCQAATRSGAQLLSELLLLHLRKRVPPSDVVAGGVVATVEEEQGNKCRKIDSTKQLPLHQTAAQVHAQTHAAPCAFGAGAGRWVPQSLDWRDITKYKETQCYVR